MALWAVVPVKGLATAKSRLAPLLAPAEREALAAALLADVLRALRATPAIARVLVVSPDPAALALAAALGAAPLAEPPPPAGAAYPGDEAALNTAGGVLSGGAAGLTAAGDARPDGEGALNAALDYAAAVAAADGATALLALPADLPRLTPADVAAVSAARPPGRSVVLAPTADGGTGALLRQPPLAVPARFGADSLRAHLRAAAACGIAARLVWRSNLSLDIDLPADLDRLAVLPHPSQTHALLVRWQAAGRWPTAAALALGRPPH